MSALCVISPQNPNIQYKIVNQPGTNIQFLIDFFQADNGFLIKINWL